MIYFCMIVFMKKSHFQDQVIKVLIRMRCLFFSGSDGALSILQKAAKLADRILMKMHPLQGKLADAMARAYATMGENSTWHILLFF